MNNIELLEVMKECTEIDLRAKIDILNKIVKILRELKERGV